MYVKDITDLDELEEMESDLEDRLYALNGHAQFDAQAQISDDLEDVRERIAELE